MIVVRTNEVCEESVWRAERQADVHPWVIDMGRAEQEELAVREIETPRFDRYTGQCRGTSLIGRVGLMLLLFFYKMQMFCSPECTERTSRAWAVLPHHSRLTRSSHVHTWARLVEIVASSQPLVVRLRVVRTGTRH